MSLEADHLSSPLPHLPVMAEEVLHWLAPKPGQTVVDATVGYGGHASLLAARLGSEGRLIGVDLDVDALAAARTRAKSWTCRVDLVHAGYDELEGVLENLGAPKVDAVLADLGISSPQVDQGERGFSFQKDGPLDMRMNQDAAMTAADWLAEAEESEIRRALRIYGEEKRAEGIARAIVRERRRGPIHTTGQLVDIIRTCFKDRARAGNVHPATRTFQALRIVVNEELERLERFLSFLPDRLGPGGRVAILAYHSLEDRLVKRAYLDWTGKPDPALRLLPIQALPPGRMKVVTPKAIRPRDEEVERNPRSRSARLRVAERTNAP